MLKLIKQSFIILVACALASISLLSWAQRHKPLSIYFRNCMDTPLNIVWDSYKYNVDAPLDPNHLKASGSFSVDKFTTINIYQDMSFFSWANGELNFHANTPRGPIWIQVHSIGRPEVLQGAAGVVWQYSRESLTFDFDCPS